MRLLPLVAVVLCLIAPTPAAAQTNPVVLKVKELKIGKDINTMVLTLVSGDVLTVKLSDIDTEQSRTLREGTSSASASASASASTSAAASSAAVISQHCQKQWSTNFQMRAFCESEQKKALAALNSRSMATTDLRTIRTHCEQQWPDNYQMRDFCEGEQMKALKALGR